MADIDLSSIFTDDRRFKQGLLELRSYANPPNRVLDTLAAVATLLGEKSTWSDCKKLMGNPKFLDMLKNVDKDNIKPKDMAKVRHNYINNPEFNPEKVREVSEAGELMCEWVLALEKYDREAKEQAEKKSRTVEL